LRPNQRDALAATYPVLVKTREDLEFIRVHMRGLTEG
jgi:hypothetical protein